MANFKNSTSLDDMDIKLRFVFEWFKPHDYSRNAFVHPYTIVWLMLSGRRDVIIGEKRYTLEQGDIAVFPPQVALTIMANAPEAGSTHHLAFACDAKLGAFDLVKLYQFPDVTRIKNMDSLHQWIKVWYNVIQHLNHMLEPISKTQKSMNSVLMLNTEETISYIQMNSLVYTWFSELISILLPHLPGKPQFFDVRVQQACVYIKRHLGEKLHIKKIAKHVYVSESHLRLLFRQSLGVSPMGYMLQTRTQRARELLMNSSFRLNEIAEMIGYEDQSQFSRAFRKIEGMTPYDYRQRCDFDF